MPTTPERPTSRWSSISAAMTRCMNVLLACLAVCVHFKMPPKTSSAVTESKESCI